jgi:hypothetical protein
MHTFGMKRLNGLPSWPARWLMKLLTASRRLQNDRQLKSTFVRMPGVDDGCDDAKKGQGNKRDQNVLSEFVMEDHNSPPVCVVDKDKTCQ